MTRILTPISEHLAAGLSDVDAGFEFVGVAGATQFLPHIVATALNRISPTTTNAFVRAVFRRDQAGARPSAGQTFEWAGAGFGGPLLRVRLGGYNQKPGSERGSRQGGRECALQSRGLAADMAFVGNNSVNMTNSAVMPVRRHRDQIAVSEA
jgi:hypothetical protein